MKRDKHHVRVEVLGSKHSCSSRFHNYLKQGEEAKGQVKGEKFENLCRFSQEMSVSDRQR